MKISSQPGFKIAEVIVVYFSVFKQGLLNLKLFVNFKDNQNLEV